MYCVDRARTDISSVHITALILAVVSSPFTLDLGISGANFSVFRFVLSRAPEDVIVSEHFGSKAAIPSNALPTKYEICRDAHEN